MMERGTARLFFRTFGTTLRFGPRSPLSTRLRAERVLSVNVTGQKDRRPDTAWCDELCDDRYNTGGGGTLRQNVV
jgi:hypothetical protein